MPVVLLVLSLAGIAVGGWGLATGIGDDGDPTALGAGLLLAASIPWTLVGLTLFDKRRNERELSASLGKPPPEPAPALPGMAQPPPAPKRIEELAPRAPQVIDGIHRKAEVGRLVKVVVVAVVLLGGGLWGWTEGWEIVGLLAAMVGAFVLSFLISIATAGRSYGATWETAPTGSWPKGKGVAEVTGVWHYGQLAGEDVVVLDLQVWADGDSWEVRIRQEVPHNWRSWIVAGNQLAVRVDPSRQQRVAVDWAGSTRPQG